MNILREPILKRGTILIGVAMTILLAALMINNLILVERVRKNSVQAMERVIGAVVRDNQELEKDVIKAFFGDYSEEKSNDYREIGQVTLNKYGYIPNPSLLEDSIYKSVFINGIWVNLGSFFIVVIFIGIIWCVSIGGISKKLKHLKYVVEEIIEGNYNIDILSYDEGIFNIIENKIHGMRGVITGTIEGIETERNKLKELLTELSHQLKTPIASMKMYNELISEEELSFEEKIEFHEKNCEDINQMEWLVDSLIKLSRLEIGMMDLNMKKKNIKNTIVNAVNGVYMKAVDKDIDIQIDISKDYELEHDERWTKEGLMNVLENAIKYSERGSSICVQVNEMGSLIKIDIKDEGIGIPEEEYNNIFKRFYRVDQSRILKEEGSGVGLYLTRKIMEKQGGNVIVKSEEGVGTVFSLLLQNCNKN
ncbi:sensor histidine kinase [Oceanirhabdus sp. W0125-5]|uniref:sensor histidine kinase n=1 Tax=Oceanirhabdus sp. W0125-5 TaxID=2999116 RepID=UPI0022F2AEB2|nr:HAMP domain-containing sensor histidine kinase [Oceanirhabdus sp. W0125-5]WBW98395.1 HAMP domain-containing sensor histidine kinase [Oceanirhabdus sp. W0125-5]